MGSSDRHTSSPPKLAKNSDRTQIIVIRTQGVGLDGGNLPAQKSFIKIPQEDFCFVLKQNIICVSPLH